jgi:4-amino-4-deoxy-L-arabinose transferase-like glycosyltransferase
MSLAIDTPPQFHSQVATPAEPQSAKLTTRSRNHPLVWIILIGAIVRVALWIAWANWTPLINDDARDYQNLAIRLATVGDYATSNGKPLSMRPPLYPAMLAGVYRAFGVENNDAATAIQAGIGLVTVLMVYRLAVITYDRQIAVWAAGFICFYPSLLGYANLLLSETLFTFFVVAFSWMVCEAIHRQSLATLAAAGVVLGLAALTRSILLLFTPFLAALVLLSWRGSWSRRFVATALPLALFAAVIAPWAVRNTRLQQTLTLIDVMGGRNAMMGNYEFTPLERSWATISSVTGEKSWDSVLFREHGDVYLRATQGQRDKLALKHALHYMADHPGLTAQRSLVKFFNFWQLERLLVAAVQHGIFGDIPLAATLSLAAVICGAYAIVLFASVFGVCCAPPADKWMHWFLIVSVLFPCVVHTLIFAHERYHLPTMPLLCIYAAAAIVRRRDVWSRRHSAGFIVATSFCVVLGLGWLREFAFVDYGSFAM